MNTSVASVQHATNNPLIPKDMKPNQLIAIFLMAVSSLSQAQTSCATAEEAIEGINFGTQITGSDTPQPEHCLALTPELMFSWYYFVATDDVTMTVTTILPANAGLDTRISVFEGTCGDLLCIGSGDDSNGGYLSNAVFSATTGTTYYIVFDTYWGGAEVASPVEFEIYEGEPSGGGGGGGGGSDFPTLITFNPEPLTGSGSSECIVDMNNDQLDDVVFVNGNSITIRYQQADGSFTSQSYNVGNVSNAPSWSIAAGDLDNNGYNDLLYGGGGGASIIMANDNGTGYTHYSDNEYIFSQRTNMVDINNDGILDAFVCHDVDANVFYISDGNGGFTYNQGGLGENGGNYGSVWIDYDNDCDMDLFIAKCGSDNIDQLHRNDGNGNFTSVAPAAGINDGSETWSSAWADYDNDGDMDVVIGASSTWNGSHKFYINNGDGTFTNITEGSGIEDITTTGIENFPCDFNNDGFVDMVGLGSVIMINDGDMTFTPADCPFYSGPAGDLNHDGYMDFFEGGTIYYNTMEGNNWLIVSTVGTESNKNGIGARITVNSALGTQIRDVRSAQAFSPMQTLNAHFGLAQDTEIESIHVCWPSGIEDVIYNPSINTHLTIVEGSTVNVEENDMNELIVYPNPATDRIQFKGDRNVAGMNYRVIDSTGRLITQGRLAALELNIAELPAGLYTISIEIDGQWQSKTFSK
jgi:hypothetical protein